MARLCQLTCHSWCAHRVGETDALERCRKRRREQRQEWMDKYDAISNSALQNHNLQPFKNMLHVLKQLLKTARKLQSFITKIHP